MKENKKFNFRNIHGMRSLLSLLKNFQNRSNLLIYLSTGLYLFLIALLIQFFISFSIGLPLMMIYPLITPFLLNLLNVMAWWCIILGILTIILPMIKQKIQKNNILLRILITILKISALTTILFVPIGIFLGMGVYTELRTNEFNDGKNKKRSEKNYNTWFFFAIYRRSRACNFWRINDLRVSFCFF